MSILRFLVDVKVDKTLAVLVIIFVVVMFGVLTLFLMS